MNDKIKYPNCGYEFEIEEALSGKIEAHYKAEYEKKVSAQAEKLNAEKRKLEAEKEQLELQKEKQDELLRTEVEKLLSKEKQKIEKQAGETVEGEIKALKEDNESRFSKPRVDQFAGLAAPDADEWPGKCTDSFVNFEFSKYLLNSQCIR